MREYELYLPLHYSDGRAIEQAKIDNLKRRLVERFGGLTHFPQENEGVWKIGSHTFRDKVEIIRVLADDDAAEFFAQLKEHLERNWQQKEFLIITRNVDAL